METGFFKWVWRFNALTIALAATGLVIVSCVILVSGARFDLPVAADSK